MDGNITKALWLGVGILFFVVVVSTGLFLLNQGQDMANAQADNITESEKALNDSKYSAFDNTYVSGSMVLNLLKEHQDKSGLFTIKVSTLSANDIFYISTGSIDKNFLVGALAGQSMGDIKAAIKFANTETHANYISPVGKFYAQVGKDAAGQIRAVIVIQE